MDILQLRDALNEIIASGYDDIPATSGPDVPDGENIIDVVELRVDGSAVEIY